MSFYSEDTFGDIYTQPDPREPTSSVKATQGTESGESELTSVAGSPSAPAEDETNVEKYLLKFQHLVRCAFHAR